MAGAKKNNVLISVIIPVYNVEKYLEKCLDTVTNNSYHNLEIICINDGSTDHSAEILLSYAEKDSRILVINQENQGVCAARNAGIQYSHGEYIAFIDSDDYIDKYYFETLVHCIVKKKADIVICNVLKMNSNNNKQDNGIRHFYYKRLDARSFFGNFYARHLVTGRLYKSTILYKHSFASNIVFTEDTIFNLEVINDLKKPLVYQTDTPLYYYIQREDSASHTWESTSLKAMADYYFDAIRDHKNYQGEWGWMLTLQVIKTTLSYRYLVRFRPDAKSLIKEANQKLFLLFQDLMRYPNMPKIEMIKHLVMYICPCLYRRYRIINDPTMRAWEEKEKKLYYNRNNSP